MHDAPMVRPSCGSLVPQSVLVRPTASEAGRRPVPGGWPDRLRVDSTYVCSFRKCRAHQCAGHFDGTPWSAGTPCASVRLTLPIVRDDVMPGERLKSPASGGPEKSHVPEPTSSTSATLSRYVGDQDAQGLRVHGGRHRWRRPNVGDEQHALERGRHHRADLVMSILRVLRAAITKSDSGHSRSISRDRMRSITHTISSADVPIIRVSSLYRPSLDTE